MTKCLRLNGTQFTLTPGTYLFCVYNETHFVLHIMDAVDLEAGVPVAQLPLETAKL